MGMPVTLEVIGVSGIKEAIDKVYDYLKYVDEQFSPFKRTSELTRINRGELDKDNWSDDMKEIFELSERTKKETDGYFDIITPDGKYNPSGLVKGWAIWNAAKLLGKLGFKDFYVDAGGDIQMSGKNSDGEEWSVGIRNPFNVREIVKVIHPLGRGVATSGTYERGQHIWNPRKKTEPIIDIVSLTVVGPNVYEADRFATAAFAMGKEGIGFIEILNGFEGYMIDKNGIATMTSGFERYA